MAFLWGRWFGRIPAGSVGGPTACEASTDHSSPIRVVIVEIPVPGHPRPLIRVDQPFSDDLRVVSSDSWLVDVSIFSNPGNLGSVGIGSARCQASPHFGGVKLLVGFVQVRAGRRSTCSSRDCSLTYLWILRIRRVMIMITMVVIAIITVNRNNHNRNDKSLGTCSNGM